jgi:acyl carrier protein
MIDDTKTATIERMLPIIRKLSREKLGLTFDPTQDQDQLLELNLIDDLGLDSVQILDLLMTVEEEFHVQLDGEHVDLDKLMNVSALVDFVSHERPAEFVGA